MYTEVSLKMMGENISLFNVDCLAYLWPLLCPSSEYLEIKLSHMSQLHILLHITHFVQKYQGRTSSDCYQKLGSEVET